MWFNGSSDMNNLDVFDFSLHQSNMQQGTEPAPAPNAVSIPFLTYTYIFSIISIRFKNA